MPILPLRIEQEAELLVYAVCAGTLVNNSTVSQSGRREAPSVLWQDHKPLVMGAASGATAKQRTHTCSGPGDQGAGARPLPPGVLPSPAPLSETCGLGGVPSGGHAASYRP